MNEMAANNELENLVDFSENYPTVTTSISLSPVIQESLGVVEQYLLLSRTSEVSTSSLINS